MNDIFTILDRPERIPNTDNPKEVGGLKITFGLDLDGRHHRDQRYRIYRKKSPSSYQDLQPRDGFNTTPEEWAAICKEFGTVELPPPPPPDRVLRFIPAESYGAHCLS